MLFRSPYANVLGEAPLPSDSHFACERVTLAPGESEGPRQLDLQDRIVYVVSGTATMQANRLAGGLAANNYLHLPATTPHQISNGGYEPLVFISLIVTDPFTAHGTVLEHE